MTALLGQLARFGLVGIAATLTHTGVAWVVHHAGVAAFPANAVGFAVAFGVSYLGHFYWTFGQRAGHRARLPRFLVVSGTGFALSNVIVWAVVVQMGAPFETALALMLVMVPATTWMLSRLWAFR